MIRRLFNRGRQARVHHRSTQTRHGMFPREHIRLNRNIFIPHQRNLVRRWGPNGGGAPNRGRMYIRRGTTNRDGMYIRRGITTRYRIYYRGGTPNRGGADSIGAQNESPSERASTPSLPNTHAANENSREMQPCQNSPDSSTSEAALPAPSGPQAIQESPGTAQVGPVIQEVPQVLISLALIPVNRNPSVYIPLLIRETYDSIAGVDPVKVTIEPMSEDPDIIPTSDANGTNNSIENFNLHSIDNEVEISTTNFIHTNVQDGNDYFEAVPLINEETASVPTVEATEPVGTEAEVASEINNNTIEREERFPPNSDDDNAQDQLYVSDGFDPSFITQAFGPLFPDEDLESSILSAELFGDEAPMLEDWFDANDPQPGPSQASYFRPNNSLTSPPPSPDSD